jgi:hypothetical protein
MRDHANIIASLVALSLVIATILALTYHGLKDETLVAILATGAVGIANSIAGVKSGAPPPPANGNGNSPGQYAVSQQNQPPA